MLWCKEAPANLGGAHAGHLSLSSSQLGWGCTLHRAHCLCHCLHPQGSSVRRQVRLLCGPSDQQLRAKPCLSITTASELIYAPQRPCWRGVSRSFADDC